MLFQGLNTKAGFDKKVAAEIAKITGQPFETAENKVDFIEIPDIWMTVVVRSLGSSRRFGTLEWCPQHLSGLPHKDR
jgi:hypothetical protein